MDENRKFIRLMLASLKETSPCAACMMLRLAELACEVYGINEQELAGSLKAHRKAGAHEG